MPDREALRRALALAGRYSVDITQLAATTLGQDRATNRDVQLILAIHGDPHATPGRLAAATGMSAAAVARALGHLTADGLVRRRPSVVDGRSTRASLTRKGQARVATFEHALADYFAESAPLVKEVLALLTARPMSSRGMGPLESAGELSAAGASYVDDVTRALEGYDVRDRAERFAIALLGERAEMRPGQFAHDLCLSSSGASDLVDRLERAGLVDRAHSAADRRAVVVRLTARGQEAAQVELDVFARHADSVCAALASTVPWHEVDAEHDSDAKENA